MARLITNENGVLISYKLFVVRSLQHNMSRYYGLFIWYTAILNGQSLRHNKPRYYVSLNFQQQCL
jgi:hypothetical protein